MKNKPHMMVHAYTEVHVLPHRSMWLYIWPHTHVCRPCGHICNQTMFWDRTACMMQLYRRFRTLILLSLSDYLLLNDLQVLVFTTSQFISAGLYDWIGKAHWVIKSNSFLRIALAIVLWAIWVWLWAYQMFGISFLLHLLNEIHVCLKSKFNFCLVLNFLG